MRGFLRAWTPYDLGPGCLSAWWSADDHGTARMTDDGAGLISNWVDRAQGLALTATTTARPTWASTAFNGAKAGLTFDGTANALVTTTLTGLPTGAVDGEIWVVCQSTRTSVDSATYCAVRYGGTADGAFRGLSRSRPSANGRAKVDVSSVEGANTLIDTALDADVALLSMRGKFSGTTLAQDVNGAAATPGSATGVTTLNTGTTRLRVGSGISGSAGNFWKGPIRHVLILRGLLPAKEEALMRAWAIADVT